MQSKHYQEAIKSDVRKMKCAIEVYLDGDNAPPTVFKDDDVIRFEILEEVASSGDTIFGRISSNTIDLYVSNMDRAFTTTNKDGEYARRLKKGTKIVPYLGIETKAGPEYVKMGVYFLADWRTPSNSTTALLTANDRLYDVLDAEVPNMPVQTNMTLGKMFDYLFKGIGIDNYELDGNLQQPIKLGWFEKRSVHQTLTDLCQVGNCYVYVDRNNIVKVKRIISDGVSGGKKLDENDLFISDNPQRVLNSYDKIDVEYSDVHVNKEDDELLRLDDLEVPEDGLEYKDLELSGGAPICEITSINVDGNMIISNLDYGAYGVSFKVRRAGKFDKCNLVIRGRVATLNTQSVQEGEGREMAVKNHLIQNKRVASAYIEDIYPHVQDAFSEVQFEYRGDPSVELYKPVTITDNINKVGSITLLPVRQRFQYDGTLRAYVDGKRVLE